MQISSCRGCGAELPEAFLDLGRTPLANSNLSSAQLAAEEPTYPLAVVYCHDCHLVQLTETVDPADLFSDYVYFSSYSDTLLQHAKRMADEYVERFELGPASRVVEVASNDGYLLQYFQGRGIPVLGVEPARNIAEHAQQKGIPTLNKFFGEQTTREIVEEFGHPDLILGNNVLAHIPEINSFLKAVCECLRDGGTAAFEFPYLGDLLENRVFDTIYHEHVFYFSLTAIEGLAKRAGLTLVDVSVQPIHGRSLRVFLHKGTQMHRSAAVEEMLKRENDEGMTTPECYSRFSEAVNRLRTELLELLNSLKQQGSRLAAYGAPAKGNTLLNFCGIDSTLLEFTVDRSPHKQGLFLPGSRIPIAAPEMLLRAKPDYAVILAWNISSEIIDQQQEYIRNGGRFIIPMPTPHVAEVATFEVAPSA